MCGIAGIINLDGKSINYLSSNLKIMNSLQSHRGPDGDGIWVHRQRQVGFGHRRLSIIDLSAGKQPMSDQVGNVIIFNGEIYNYKELRAEIGKNKFRTNSDTEVILLAYQTWGRGCVDHLRGMFSFAIWDERNQTLFCARDRFGIKPFYYLKMRNCMYFASEAKALLPYVSSIETDTEGLKDYLTFQFCLAGKTLFKNISELLPAHTLVIKNGCITISKYWEVYFNPQHSKKVSFFEEKLRFLWEDSIRAHLCSDVPLGAYVSGGIDSSAIASVATKFIESNELLTFTGKYGEYGPEFDESNYARILAKNIGCEIKEADISCADFKRHIAETIYHMDYPAAGPGLFSQFMVSKLAARFRKVCLGGQGGDEIFGGYTRYLVAYFEQCIKGAIDGTMKSGNFIVTYKSIIPNLSVLYNYKPMLIKFWHKGLFDEMDKRYFSLINRAEYSQEEINWKLLGDYSPFETFQSIFHGNNVKKESYFDLMTNFDFKTLLPALLQVEDRVSMAHGLESRVPFLDHPLVEFAATIPADVKFQGGDMKHVFKKVVRKYLPREINERKDKMGFPTPVAEWMNGDAKKFIKDVFHAGCLKGRPFVNNLKILDTMESEPKYGRKLWGLLCLELWYQQFHDNEAKFKKLLLSRRSDA